MATKTYTLGGTTKFNGVTTFRVANGKLNLRRNMLKHFGHENIKLVELPKAMPKLEAVAWLIQQGYKGVIPTRAENKRAKNEMQLEAEKMAAKRLRAAEQRRAKKAAAEAVEVAA